VSRTSSWKCGPPTRLRSKRSTSTDKKETRPRKRMTAPLRGRGEVFVVWVRPKQDEIEMEARGLGSEGPGACLKRRGGAPRCTRESVRLQDPVLPDLVSALTFRTEQHGIVR
jgi:hypothetical protein